MDCKCRNHPDHFRYIRGNMILPCRIAKMTVFVKKPYHGHFRVKLGAQRKAFTHHVSCKTCVEELP